MACHEIAGLRLGLMAVLGIKNEVERQHELTELGRGADAPGPIRSMCESQDLVTLTQCFESAVAALEARVSDTRSDDSKLAYLRTLVVLTKKVELDLAHQVESLTHLYRDLEEMHDFVHEMYPGE